MVEDRITDGKRIAQLFASELTGLTTPPLDRVGVDDADPAAEPSAGGTFAYGVTLDGKRIGEVFVHETTARVDLSVVDEAVVENAGADGLRVTDGDDGVRVHVEYGAAVKRAVDLLVAVVADQ